MEKGDERKEEALTEEGEKDRKIKWAWHNQLYSYDFFSSNANVYFVTVFSIYDLHFLNSLGTFGISYRAIFLTSQLIGKYYGALLTIFGLHFRLPTFYCFAFLTWGYIHSPRAPFLAPLPSPVYYHNKGSWMRWLGPDFGFVSLYFLMTVTVLQDVTYIAILYTDFTARYRGTH